jgi:fructose-bisphosphate aldolase class I
MEAHELYDTAQAIVADNKGILAADESTGTIKKRFDSIGIESTEESRRFYRQLLFTAPGIEESIGGVILYDETLRQSAADGTPFAEVLASKGVTPGIKVDTGAHDLSGFPGEKITEGLDGLRARFAEYRELGARFAKWRAVITIGEGTPSTACSRANAHALARYAALCQEAGIVPIVEPEVLMDGAHGLDACYAVTSRTLVAVFNALYQARIDLPGMILKPNMVIAGKKCAKQASRQEVAERTVKILRRCVPVAVPGIAFLSGGQSDEDATAHLSLMNQQSPFPWKLSFSYGRALQAACLKAWGGKPENVAAGQRAFSHRAKMNGVATLGKWSEQLEKAA